MPQDKYQGESETDPNPPGWKAQPPWMDIADYRKGAKKAKWRLIPFAQPKETDSIEMIKAKLGPKGLRRKPSGEEKQWLSNKKKKKALKIQKADDERHEGHVKDAKFDALMKKADLFIKRREAAKKKRELLLMGEESK